MLSICQEVNGSVRLQELTLINYKIFTEQKFVLNGKSTIIFGINGTGKSTVLSAVNYLNRVWINRLNPAQGKAFMSFSDDISWKDELVYRR